MFTWFKQLLIKQTFVQWQASFKPRDTALLMIRQTILTECLQVGGKIWEAGVAADTVDRDGETDGANQADR